MKNFLQIFLPLSQIFLKDKSSFRFAIGIIIGLAFSISIILCTIGIMDGFDAALKSALKNSSGDLFFHSRDGFFPLSADMKKTLENLSITEYSGQIQTESFLIFNEENHGVLLRGIDPESFNKVTGLNLKIPSGQVLLGAELKKKFHLNVGDEVVLTFVSSGNEGGLPILKRFRIGAFVAHGIYQKDLRLVYIERDNLSSILNLGEKMNVVSLNLPKKTNDLPPYKKMPLIEDLKKNLSQNLGDRFIVKPFWSEFSALLEAVQIEKNTIGLTLQTIVVIAVFNVLAFIIFLTERHSRAFFLFKALGLSSEKLFRMWFFLITFIWAFSSLLSIFFVKIFAWALHSFSIFELPADIYYMGRLSILISPLQYGVIFFLTFIWLMIISWFGLKRLRKRSILQGLRREFS